MTLKRFLKNRLGGVVELTTNCEPTMKTWMAETDRKNEFGHILRKTRAEAENDDTPKP